MDQREHSACKLFKLFMQGDSYWALCLCGQEWANWVQNGDMVRKVVLIGLAALAGQRKGTALNPSADGTFVQPPHPDL